jgi:hypothetical protein
MIHSVRARGSICELQTRVTTNRVGGNLTAMVLITKLEYRVYHR